MVARQRLDLPGATIGLQSRLQRQERNAPLGFSSITRGGLRVQSPDGIQVKTVAGGAPGMRITGLQVVDGTLRVTGTLEGGGTWTWSGTLTQTGTTNLNGPWHLNGNGDISGNAAITGILTLLSNLVVGSGGKIIVGSMVIDPADGGSVIFPGGAVVRAGSGGGVAVQQGSYAAVITSSGASVGRSGRSISVTEAGFRMDGIPNGSPSNGTQSGVVYLDGTGYLRRSTGS